MHNYDAQQHRVGQIIFSLTFQTITIAQMLSVGGEGSHRATGQVRVCVSGQYLLNKMTFDLDLWQACSS